MGGGSLNGIHGYRQMWKKLEVGKNTSLLSIRSFLIYLSLQLPTYLSIYKSNYLHIYLSIYISINLSIYLSTYLSVYLGRRSWQDPRHHGPDHDCVGRPDRQPRQQRDGSAGQVHTYSLTYYIGLITDEYKATCWYGVCMIMIHVCTSTQKSAIQCEHRSLCTSV